RSADVAADPLSDGIVTLTIPQGAAKAKDGRITAASHPASIESNTVIVDTTKPRATIDLASGQLESARSSPVVFVLDFSERVQSVTLDDIELTGTAQRGSPTLLETRTGERFILTVPVSSDGTVVASLRADRVSDRFG